MNPIVKIVDRNLPPNKILKKISRINTAILMYEQVKTWLPGKFRLQPYQMPKYVKQYYKELITELN